MPESVTQVHEEKKTLVEDVNLPGHDARVTTPLFTQTRRQALERCGHRCEVSGETEAEGGPVEFHHFFVERCLATQVDPVRLHHWLKLLNDRSGLALQWFADQIAAGKSYEDIWSDPYLFTDDMMHNGLGLCKRLHTGRGQGIHAMDFPLWSMWAIGTPGYKFVGQQAIVDEQEPAERIEAGDIHPVI